MKILSSKKLADTVIDLRKSKGLTQEKLAEKTGINRILLGRIEKGSFIPSIIQFESLSRVLGFDITDMFTESEKSDSFVALRSKSLNDCEREGFEKLITMMLSIRQQIKLRSSFENESNRSR